MRYRHSSLLVACNIIRVITQNYRFILFSLGIGRLGEITSRISGGNRNGSWKRIRGILGSFVPAGNIFNGNGMDIQSWATKINCKGIIEAVIKCHIVVLYHINFLVLALL